MAPKKKKKASTSGQGEASEDQGDGEEKSQTTKASKRPAAAATTSSSSSPPNSTSGASSASATSAGSGGGNKPAREKSVWNSKDTWEEKDVTDWAVDRIAEILEGQTLDLQDMSKEPVSGSMKIKQLKEAQGHAQVVYFQGKKRFLFDLSFEIVWVASITSESLTEGEAQRFKGRMEVSEVVQDFDDEDIEIAVPFNPKSKAHSFVKDLLLTRADGSVAAAVCGALRQFQQEFQAGAGTGANTSRSSRRVDQAAVESKKSKARDEARQAAEQQDSLKTLLNSNPNCKVTM